MGQADPLSDKRLSRRSVDPRQLSERYKQLEDDALGRVYKGVDSLLGHVNEVRKRLFLCAAMEVRMHINLNTYFSHCSDTLGNNIAILTYQALASFVSVHSFALTH